MKVPVFGWKAVILLLGLAVVLAILPLVGLPRTWLLFLFLFFVYLALANMWNLLSGYCGLISLCQPAFIGLAGYALVIFTWNGLPVYLGIAGRGRCRRAVRRPHLRGRYSG